MEDSLTRSSAETASSLYRRAGFLARRLHQAATAIFAEECSAFDVTQLQYGALTFLRAEPHLDQITLGKRLGLDRSTIGMVVRNLEGRAFVQRSSDPRDARRRTMTITPAGCDLLDDLFARALRAQERLLAPLTQHERDALLAALTKVTADLNPRLPTPIEPPPRA